MKKYPFKFLDAYTKADQAIFFGREEEVEELYRTVFQANLMLVYGASGTGKTSLIRCGLANRFKPTQWLDLYIRRGNDINQSLLDMVVKHTPEKGESKVEAKIEVKEEADPVVSEVEPSEAKSTASEAELDWFESLMEKEQEGGIEAEEPPTFETDNPVARALQALYLATFTPIYLIFDQFEELYTLGKPEEQRRFTETIEALVQLPLPLKIIIVMREEYLARLYELEKAVPQLRNKKLRIEPMGLPQVEGVILSATARNPASNIELEEGKEAEIARAIIEKVREEDVNIKLPYLQVFMDRLYEKATGEAVDRQPPAFFSLDLVNQMGNIGDVLADFIDRQSQRIYRKLAQDYDNLPTDIAWQMLSPFATVDGTKIPIHQDKLATLPQALKLPGLRNTGSLMKAAIAELENSRILRFRKEEGTYEVAHDSLALQIAEKRSEEEKAYLKAKRIVTESCATYQDTQTYLSREQLAFIRPYEERLEGELNDSQWAFLAESRKKRRRQQVLLWSGVAAAFLVAFLVIIYVFGQQQIARQAQKDAEDAKQEAVYALAESKRSEAIADSTAEFARKKSNQLAVSLEKLEVANTEAERNARVAQQKTAEAQATLTNLQQSNADVVRLILQNAEQDVLKLQYEAALSKIKAAASLGVQKEKVAQAYLELAFWHNEAGHARRALGILDSAAALTARKGLAAGLGQLPKDTTAAREKLRGVLQQFDSTAYEKLWERYYPVMVDVPGGTFTMGCDTAIDNNCQNDETQHPATVSDFQIAKYETTWWQYYLFCQAAGHEYESPGWGTDGNNPVVNVNWYDAVAYANWVSGQKGWEKAIFQDTSSVYQANLRSKGYRLPTEAEWEYAAKEGRAEQLLVYSGSNNLDSVGWYRSNSNSRTQPVGQLKANALGLYDMSGNVGEWCWDWKTGYPDSLIIDYPGAKSGSSRVLRGGSWYTYDYNCRVANRHNYYPEDRNYNIGFRLSRAP